MTSTMRFRPKKGNKISLNYFKYFLQTRLFTNQLQKLITGSAQLNFGPSHIKKISIPLPPLPTQRRIAAALDLADRQRQLLRAEIAAYGELGESLFLEMFGDPVVNTMEWKVQTILSLISEGRPLTYGILMPGSDTRPKGVPYIKVRDVKNGRILADQVCYTTTEISDKYRRSLLKENDVLLSIRGHVGRMAIVPEKYEGANITQDTARISLKRFMNPVYVERCMSTVAYFRYMQKYVKGVAVKGINLGDVKKLKLPVPPSEVQQIFAERIQKIEVLKSQAETALAEADDLFNTLLQRAFRGELFAEEEVASRG